MVFCCALLESEKRQATLYQSNQGYKSREIQAIGTTAQRKQKQNLTNESKYVSYQIRIENVGAL